MKYLIILLIFLLIPLAFADTTFFDNPDDAFIMSGTATGGVIEGTTGRTTGGGCLTNWTCSAWSSCINGNQTRNCTDLNNCNNLTGKPTKNQSCSVETENNAGQEEENLISQNPLINFKNIIAAVIGLIVIIGIAVFFLHKHHSKRRYWFYEY